MNELEVDYVASRLRIGRSIDYGRQEASQEEKECSEERVQAERTIGMSDTEAWRAKALRREWRCLA